eukprot:m51a1_g5854 hypothetical protein (706) ;mRNA; f:353067-356683
MLPAAVRMLDLVNREESIRTALRAFGEQFDLRHSEQRASQQLQPITFGSPGSGKSRLLTALMELLHGLTLERADRTERLFDGVSQAFVHNAASGAVCIGATFSHYTPYRFHAVDNTRTLPASLATRLLLQHYFEIQSQDDCGRAFGLMGNSVFELDPLAVAESIVRDTGCRALFVFVDDAFRVEDDPYDPEQPCSRALCAEVRRVQGLTRSAWSELGCVVHTLVTTLDEALLRGSTPGVPLPSIGEDALVGALSRCAARDRDDGPYRLLQKSLQLSRPPLLSLALACGGGHARTIVMLVQAMTRVPPPADLAQVLGAVVHIMDAGAWPSLTLGLLAPALLGVPLRTNVPANALCPGLPLYVAVAQGIYDNALETVDSAEIIPRVSVVRMLRYSHVELPQLPSATPAAGAAPVTAGAAEAEVDSRIHEVHGVHEEAKRWTTENWKGEVQRQSAIGIEEHVRHQLARMFDPEALWRWESGSPMHRLIAGRAVLWPTMHAVQTLGVADPSSVVCEMSLADLLGPHALYSERTAEAIAGVTVRMVGRSALVVSERCYEDFPLVAAPVDRFGGCLDPRANVVVHCTRDSPECDFDFVEHYETTTRGRGRELRGMIVLFNEVVAQCTDTHEAGIALDYLSPSSAVQRKLSRCRDVFESKWGRRKNVQFLSIFVSQRKLQSGGDTRKMLPDRVVCSFTIAAQELLLKKKKKT